MQTPTGFMSRTVWADEYFCKGGRGMAVLYVPISSLSVAAAVGADC